MLLAISYRSSFRILSSILATCSMRLLNVDDNFNDVVRLFVSVDLQSHLQAIYVQSGSVIAIAFLFCRLVTARLRDDYE
jgi:uncharacterized MAPEG superfamily protein